MGRVLSASSLVRVRGVSTGLGATLVRGGNQVGFFPGNYGVRDANDAAQNGDTILWNAGEYVWPKNSYLFIYKNLTIEAVGGLVILRKDLPLDPNPPHFFVGGGGADIPIHVSWLAHGNSYPNLRGNVTLRGIEIWADSGQFQYSRDWYPGGGDYSLILIHHAFEQSQPGWAGDLTLDRCYLHDCSMGMSWVNGIERYPSDATRTSTLTVKNSIFRWLGNIAGGTNSGYPPNHMLYGGDHIGTFDGCLFESKPFPEAPVPPTGANGMPSYTGEYQTQAYGVGHMLKWQCDYLYVRGCAFVFDTYGTNSPVIEMTMGCQLTVEDCWFEMKSYADAQDSMIRYCRNAGTQWPWDTSTYYAEHWTEGCGWRIRRNTFVNNSSNFFANVNRHVEISCGGYGGGGPGNGHIAYPAGFDTYLASKGKPFGNPAIIEHNVFSGPGNPPTTDPDGKGIWGSPYPTNKAVPLSSLVDATQRVSGWELKDYAGATLPAPVARKQYVHGDNPAAGQWPSCVDVVSDKYGAVAAPSGGTGEAPEWFKTIAPNTWGHITRADGYSLAAIPGTGEGWLHPAGYDALSWPAAPSPDKQVYMNTIGGSLYYVDACAVLCQTSMHNPQIGKTVSGTFFVLPPVGGHGGAYDNSMYAIGPLESDDCRHFGVTKYYPNPIDSNYPSFLTPTGRSVASHTYGTPCYIAKADSLVWGLGAHEIAGYDKVQPGVQMSAAGIVVGMKLGLDTYTDQSNDAAAFRLDTWPHGTPTYPISGGGLYAFGGLENHLIYDEVRDELWQFGQNGNPFTSGMKNASVPGGKARIWEITSSGAPQWSPIGFADGRFLFMTFLYAPWQWFILDRDYAGPQGSSAAEQQKLFATSIIVSGLPTSADFPARCWSNNQAAATITRSGLIATVTGTSPNFSPPVGAGQSFTLGVYGADQPEYNGTFTALATGANTATYTVPGSPSSPGTGPIKWTSIGGVGACVAYDPGARRVYVYYHTDDGLSPARDLWVIDLPPTLVTYDASWNPTIGRWSASRLVVSGGITPEWPYMSVNRWSGEEQARVKAAMRKNFAFMSTPNGVKGIVHNTRLDAPPSFFRLP